MSALVLPSFAKINWILKILGRRADGYHEVHTVLQSIDLCDEIAFEEAQELQLNVKGLPVPADPSNLILKSAHALRVHLRKPFGARITLTKRIPLGAGLGGGSSNAAITLLALNRIWKSGLTPSELQGIASELGSDVPHFLSGGASFAWGRGERILPLKAPVADTALVLLYPGFSLSTPDAYRIGNWPPLPERAMLTRGDADTRIQRFREAAGSSETLWAVAENDFESPLYQHYPDLARARDALIKGGCAKTLVSGSGSTLIGQAAESEIQGLVAKLRRVPGYQVFSCRTLSQEEYLRRLRGVASGPRPPSV